MLCPAEFSVEAAPNARPSVEKLRVPDVPIVVERCAVPVAASDADEAAWFDIAELQDLEEAKLLAGPVSQCVNKGVRSFEAGLLGALEPCLV